MKNTFVKVSMIAMLLSSAVMAGPGPGPGPGPEGPHDGPGKYPHIFSLQKFDKELSLSKEQLAKVEVLNAQFKLQQQVNFDAMAPLKKQLDELLLQDAPDYTAIKQVLDQMAPLRVDMHLSGIQHMKGIEQVLTPEQRAKLKEIRQEKMKKYKHSHKEKRDKK